MSRLAPLVLLVGCGNCQIGSDPIPGGFDPAARIERAAQVRLTASGIDVLEVAAADWIADAARLSCTGDADCPAALGSSCVSSECTGSFVAVDLPASTPGRVFASIDGLALAPAAPSSLIATVSTRLASTPIPGDQCASAVDPQSLSITVDLAMAPSSSGRIGLTVASVTMPRPAISGTCSTAFNSDIEASIRAASVAALRDLVASAVGQPCDVPADCPAGAGCVAERCREADQVLLPGLDTEERITVPPVLEAYDTGDAVSDLAIQIGGTISADASGVTTGVRGGMELVYLNTRCANPVPSPRLRPSFLPPPPLPAGDAVDLDFDGVPETPYQLALAVSKAFIDQAIWSAYGGGLFCGALTTADFDDLHTGTLAIIIPSVRFLTKSHLFPRSEKPARVSAWLRQDPEVRIGSGEAIQSGGDTQYVDPLVHLFLRDFEINLSAFIEERWVRILTATIDFHLGIAVMVTPDNQLEPIVGVGVDEIISNIRITNSELLQEDPAAIAQALPTLLSFALLEFAGSAGQFPIPTPEGLELDVLGIRGVPGAAGRFDHLAIYADLTAASGSNLSAAAETEARLVEVRTPQTDAFAVGRMELPQIELALSGSGSGELEWQTRIDGGFWSPFTSRPSLTMSRPELAIQGRHLVEVRARVKGDYRTLDPTPVALDFWIDSEPPMLEVSGATVRAWDRVSRDRITVEAIDAAGARPLALDANGEAVLPDGALRVRATDQAGLSQELVLAEAPATSEERFGCTAAEGSGPAGGILLLALVLFVRRRGA